MSLIDVSDAFDDLLEAVQLTRQGVGSRDLNGDWVDGVETITFPLVVAQSLTADERLVLPEAVRTKETVKFHSKVLFRTTDESTQVVADEILYQNIVYQIIQVFNRKNVGGYSKSIGAKK